MGSPRTTAEEFWARIQIGPATDCWEWTGRRDRKGYGRTGSRHLSTTRLAHRIAYELTYGPIKPGLNVCHHCDNPPCCNPAHRRSYHRSRR